MKNLIVLVVVTVLVGCGGGGGGGGSGGGNADTDLENNNSDLCLSDFQSNKASFESINGGLISANTLSDELNYLQFDSGLSTTLNSYVTEVMSTTGRYITYVDDEFSSDAQVYDFYDRQFVGFPSTFTLSFSYMTWSPLDNFFVAKVGAGFSIFNLDTLTVIPLPAPIGNPSRIVWSPNEQMFALLSLTRIQIFSVDGTLIWEGVYPGYPDDMVVDNEFEFSHDSEFAAFVINGAGLKLTVLNLQTETVSVIDTDNTFGVKRFKWSPQSTHLAFVHYEDHFQFNIFSAEDQSIRSVFPYMWDYTWAPDGSYVAFHAFNDAGEESLRVFGVSDEANSSVVVSPYMEAGYDLDNFAWSPNSRYLAMVVEPNGSQGALYVADIPGSCSKHINRALSSNEEVGREIDWSNSGAYILYTIFRSSTDGELLAIEGNGESSINLSQIIVEQDLSKLNIRDWALTSDSVLVVRRIEGTPHDTAELNLINLQSMINLTSVANWSDINAERYWFIPES